MSGDSRRKIAMRRVATKAAKKTARAPAKTETGGEWLERAKRDRERAREKATRMHIEDQRKRAVDELLNMCAALAESMRITAYAAGRKEGEFIDTTRASLGSAIEKNLLTLQTIKVLAGAEGDIAAEARPRIARIVDEMTDAASILSAVEFENIERQMRAVGPTIKDDMPF